MSHVLLLSGWLTSLLRKTTHWFLKCFYVVVYSFDGSCNLVVFISWPLGSFLPVYWMQEVTSCSLCLMRLEVSLLTFERAVDPSLQKPSLSVPLSQWLFGAIIQLGDFHE